MCHYGICFDATGYGSLSVLIAESEMLVFVVITWCRATCFGRPIGPWRCGVSAAREDLIARNLGCYEDGAFYTTVPGGMQMKSEWVTAEEEAALLARTMKRAHPSEHGERLPVTDHDGLVRRVRRAWN